jgi:hypothetical protein
VTILERTAVSGDALAKLVVDLLRAEPVAEAFVLSTRNRVPLGSPVSLCELGFCCRIRSRGWDHLRMGKPSPAAYRISGHNGCWGMAQTTGQQAETRRQIGGYRATVAATSGCQARRALWPPA